MTRLHKIATLSALLMGFAAPALAQQTLVLKAQVTDADGLVTLSDVFDNAGAAAGVALGRRTGPTVVLDAGQVQAVAAQAGASWSNPRGLRRIIVSAGQDGLPPQDSVTQPTAVLSAGNREVLVFSHAMNAGDMVQPEDLTYARLAAVGGGAPSDARAVIGKVVRYPLRQGAAVRLGDLSSPVVVKRLEAVSVTWSANGMSLSMTGIAQKDGAAGDVIQIQNPASKKLVDAVVTGPGQAIAGPAADQLRSATPVVLALMLKVSAMRPITPAITLTALALAAALTGCASVGEAVNGPALTAMSYPSALVPSQQAITAPGQDTQPASANSLWRIGARAFFNDQRARRVGDIVTVMVSIDDSAQTSNTADRSRTSSYDAATPGFFGLESSLGKLLPSQYDPAAALKNGSSSTFTGNGSVKRAEKISVTIAAIVTGVLPNGNLIIQGTQEVRTDREVRVLTVSGIARPEDISSTNAIKHTQMAEARISYGGRGDVSNAVTPPVSQALMDKFSPF